MEIAAGVHKETKRNVVKALGKFVRLVSLPLPLPLSFYVLLALHLSHHLTFCYVDHTNTNTSSKQASKQT
jgi:hypothetical protein